MTDNEPEPRCDSERAKRPKNLGLLAVTVVFVAVLSVTGILAIPLGAADDSSFAVSGNSPAAGITTLFRRTTGWIGGDAAYSVRLDDDKVLWTFGDSWIGKIRDGKRTGCAMVNNSAATQSLRARQQPLQFHWRIKDGKPRALWAPSDRGRYYWPGDAAMIERKLYLFLHVIKPKPDAPPPFQFEQVEDILMQVDNPLADPFDWRFQTVSLGKRKSDINFGIACSTDEDYLYAYCSYPPAGKGLERHPIVLARIGRSPLAKLDMSAWEYWCGGKQGGHHGQWQKRLSEPIVLMADGAPEMSVSKVRGIPGIVATYMPPFSRQIFVRHSPKPEGPWSKPLLAYSCPEREKGILLYSAKGHPEQPSGPGELVVTYCRNSEDFAWHISRPDIYFPQAVTIRLRPPAQGSGKG